MAAGAEEIAVFAAASESFSQQEHQLLDRREPGALRAGLRRRRRRDGFKVRGYVSCVLGCPYEGAVAPATVAACRRDGCAAMGCYEVSLGDTIGVGTPGKAAAMIEAVAARVPARAARRPFPRHLWPGARQYSGGA